MSVTSERLKESYAMKNKIIELLKSDGPMTFTLIKDRLNLTKGELSNFMMSLKRTGFVQYYELDYARCKNQKRYSIVPEMPSYDEAMAEIRQKTAENRKYCSVKKNETIPGAKVVSSDDYHTRGNKHKTQAWFGYEGNGGL